MSKEQEFKTILIIQNNIKLLEDNTGTKLKETILNDLKLLVPMIQKEAELEAYKEVWHWIEACGEAWASKYPFEFYNQLKTYLELSGDIIEEKMS